MKNITGPPVVGDNFFGRQEELDFVWGKISDGNNILFPSPRRVGKTSFSKQQLRIAKTHKWRTLELNLEEAKSELEFMRLIVREQNKLTSFRILKTKGARFLETLKSIKPTVSMGEVKVGVEWQEKKRDLYEQLEGLLDHQAPTLIFLDELGVFLSRLAQEEGGDTAVSDFLHWLRALRQQSDSNIRWVICSSVSVENFASKLGVSDTINDLMRHRLYPFSPEDSLRLLQKLSEKLSYELNPAILDKIISKLGYCIPFFLQLMFSKVDAAAIQQKSLLQQPDDLIATAYHEIVQGSDLNTWVERIEKQYTEEKRPLITLLSHASQARKGVTRNALLTVLIDDHGDDSENTLRHCLDILKNDGYLYLGPEDRYLFLSPLIRDFWYHKFVQ